MAPELLKCLALYVHIGNSLSRRLGIMADGDGGSGPGNFVWAIALIIIVAIVAAVVMSGGFLSGGDKKIDVEIKTPTR